MLTSLHVQNFRCFQDFQIGPLARLNLIAGKHNAGKTALLESLLLFSSPSNPSLAVGLNKYRGLNIASLVAEELWGWLFFSRRLDSKIRIAGKKDDRTEDILEIGLTNPAASWSFNPSRDTVSRKGDDDQLLPLVASGPRELSYFFLGR